MPADQLIDRVSMSFMTDVSFLLGTICHLDIMLVVSMSFMTDVSFLHQRKMGKWLQ